MTSRATTLRWAEAPWVSPGARANVDRAFYPPGFAFPRHRHDYAEVFWVEQGGGWHVDADGRRQLRPGDCAFVHPDCVHHLAAADGHSLRFTNVALRGDVFRTMAQRYAEEWAWSPAEAVILHHLANHEREVLERLVMPLVEPGGGRSPLAVEAFLTGSLSMVASRDRAAERPAWLSAWLDQPEDPEILAGGVAALAERAGCSREHVNRLVRRYCGCTARDLVTRVRLDLAARRLRASRASIPAIAADCGFESLGNFYRLFGRTYGSPPKRYRDRRTGFV